MADAEKSGEINSQDAHNKMDAYQNSKIIIEQAKTNDLLAQQLTNQAVQQQLAQEQAEKDRQSIVTRSNDDRIFFRVTYECWFRCRTLDTMVRDTNPYVGTCSQ